MSNLLSLEIGKRAIMTSQTALSITGHNISNANTAGYTRQVANLVTTRPYYTPSLTSGGKLGQLGTGVEIASITRLRDAFLDGQIRNELKTTGYWSAMQETLSKIEVILNEPSKDGLRTVMDQFWESWQDLSANPESEAVRTVVAERGAAMADAFNHAYQQLTELREDVNVSVQVKVDEINSISQQLADLNKQILSITIAGQQPNDLLDKRDLLIDSLSQIVDTRVAYDENGMIAVQLGGRPLVQGIDFIGLTTRQDTEGMHQVVWADTLSRVRVEGGELRGFLDARGASGLDDGSIAYKETIPTMMDQLNQLAKTIILRTNEIHRSGFSLNNQTGYPDGINFFSEPAITAGDIDWAAIMQVNTLISDDPQNIAAAFNRTWNDAGEKTNFGDGSIALQIAQLKQDYNQPQYTVTSDVLGVTFPYDAAVSFSLTYNGSTVNINIGQPSTQVPAKDPYQDLNQIAAAIQEALETNNLPIQVRSDGSRLVLFSSSGLFTNVTGFFGTTGAVQAPVSGVVRAATADDYWRSTCAEVGIMSQEAQRMIDNQEALVTELENKRLSLSGVSLDEEMTNMIKFQHAYNAASRYITTIDEAMDRIINNMGIVGR